MRPLCVDLDGTLVRTDLLVESYFALLRTNFLYFFAAIAWLLKGRANFKKQIADRVKLDPTTLPYTAEFLQYLREQKDAGRVLVLATASDERNAAAVAEHLGLFERVFGSDGRTNLKGTAKVELLVREFGDHGFDYAGDAATDLKVWVHAERAVAVNVSQSVLSKLKCVTVIDRVFEKERRRVRTYIKALRVNQWLKNLLVFLPLFISHLALEPELVSKALVAFVSFGLCASSVYLLNDLLDIGLDRKHPTKRNRPLAAGDMALVSAITLAPVLLALAFVLAWWLLPLEFLAVLGTYYFMTLSYSFRLKRVALLDVLVLAFLYTLRIVAGAAAISVVPSFWLLAFSMFLFLSLALVKRYTEISVTETSTTGALKGRGYWPVDKETIAQFGTSSAFMSALVLALYINSDTVVDSYSRPEFLWALCPLLLYIIGRIWILARRGHIDDDPVVFAAKDRRSQGCVVVGALVLLAAI